MNEILQKLPEQDATEALTDQGGRYKRFFDPVSIAVGVGSSILGWVFDFFRAKEVQNLQNDLNHLQDNVYKLTDNQKLLFATTVKHHEILVNNAEYIRVLCRPGQFLHRNPTNVLAMPRQSQDFLHHGGSGPDWQNQPRPDFPIGFREHG